MHENVTSDQFDEEQYEILDVLEELSEHEIRSLFEKCFLPVLIIFGTTCNVLAFVILVRRHLWLQHEGYLYLAAALFSNIVQLSAICSSWWLYLLNHSYHITNTVDILCKFWTLLTRVIQSDGWLIVALLFNICLRCHVSRRCGCTKLAAKYCTLFGTQVVLVLFLVASVLVNLWLSMIMSLHYFRSDRYCYAQEVFDTEVKLMKLFSDFLANYLPTLILVPVLCLTVVCVRSRNSGFSFNEIDGDDDEDDDDDLRELAKASLCCAAALFILRSPIYLIHTLTEFKFLHHYPYRLSFALRLVSWTYPASVPVICFVVLTRFREDIKSMTKRCFTSVRNLCSRANRNSNAALQMDLIVVNQPVSGQ